jgi:hypothetical protein
MLPAPGETRHHVGMRRLSTPRGAMVRDGALQVGEFVVGVAVAYAALMAAWAVSATAWSIAAAVVVLIAIGVFIEVRLGPRYTGLVAGLLPTALVGAGLLIALSQVLYRIG